jgi:hypothetical protein
MRRSNIGFREEPGATVLAYALLLLPFAVIELIPKSGIEPRALRLYLPFILIAPGVVALRRLRAPASIAYVFLASAILTVACLVAGAFTALTGFTFSKYNPHEVPRLAALNYVYVALVASVIAVVSAMHYQNRLREIDG